MLKKVVEKFGRLRIVSIFAYNLLTKTLWKSKLKSEKLHLTL
jgi:hypothetical protein